MKNRAEKIGKFRFKMNFGLDSGACRDARASHYLSLNELSERICFVSPKRGRHSLSFSQ